MSAQPYVIQHTSLTVDIKRYGLDTLQVAASACAIAVAKVVHVCGCGIIAFARVNPERVLIRVGGRIVRYPLSKYKLVWCSLLGVNTKCSPEERQQPFDHVTVPKLGLVID
jgi:hypothetical protein